MSAATTPEEVGVLIVEDDEIQRHLLARFFASEGYLVWEAQNGNEALDVIRAKAQPLVIILDWFMHPVDGLAVLQTMHADQSLCQNCIFLVMSAGDERIHFDECITTMPSMSATYMAKPYDLDQVEAFVLHARTCLS